MSRLWRPPAVLASFAEQASEWYLQSTGEADRRARYALWEFYMVRDPGCDARDIIAWSPGGVSGPQSPILWQSRNLTATALAARLDMIDRVCGEMQRRGYAAVRAWIADIELCVVSAQEMVTRKPFYYYFCLSMTTEQLWRMEMSAANKPLWHLRGLLWQAPLIFVSDLSAGALVVNAQQSRPVGHSIAAEWPTALQHHLQNGIDVTTTHSGEMPPYSSSRPDVRPNARALLPPELQYQIFDWVLADGYYVHMQGNGDVQRLCGMYVAPVDLRSYSLRQTSTLIARDFVGRIRSRAWQGSHMNLISRNCCDRLANEDMRLLRSKRSLAIVIDLVEKGQTNDDKEHFAACLVECLRPILEPEHHLQSIRVLVAMPEERVAGRLRPFQSRATASFHDPVFSSSESTLQQIVTQQLPQLQQIDFVAKIVAVQGTAYWHESGDKPAGTWFAAIPLEVDLPLQFMTHHLDISQHLIRLCLQDWVSRSPLWDHGISWTYNVPSSCSPSEYAVLSTVYAYRGPYNVWHFDPPPLDEHGLPQVDDIWALVATRPNG